MDSVELGHFKFNKDCVHLVNIKITIDFGEFIVRIQKENNFMEGTEYKAGNESS